MNYEESGSGVSRKILNELVIISFVGRSTVFLHKPEPLPLEDNGYVTIPVYITVCQVTQVIAALLGRVSRTGGRLVTTLYFRCGIKWNFIWPHPFGKWLQA